MSETTPRAARIRRIEEQMCPRRAENPGPWRDQGQDWWERGRWAATQEEADAEVADFLARTSPGSSIGHVLWSYGGEQPRCCSYCGGVHPDDAIALVKAGWHVDRTTKGYKVYLEPPSGPHPVPPVKVYVQHFSEQQVADLNAAWKATP